MLIEMVDSKTFKLLCPHCEQELSKILIISDLGTGGFWSGTHHGYCYACPHCHKVLGFADSN